MKANLGALDKTVRSIISLILILLLITGFITGIYTLPGWLLAVGLMATVAIGSCPVYSLFGINTKKNLNDKAYTYYRNQKHISWHN